jgi:hypothetical protein
MCSFESHVHDVPDKVCATVEIVYIKPTCPFKSCVCDVSTSMCDVSFVRVIQLDVLSKACNVPAMCNGLRGRCHLRSPGRPIDQQFDRTNVHSTAVCLRMTCRVATVSVLSSSLSSALSALSSSSSSALSALSSSLSEYLDSGRSGLV